MWVPDVYKRHLAVNGMSYSKRDSENANSALIVTVDNRDFGLEDVLALSLIHI